MTQAGANRNDQRSALRDFFSMYAVSQSGSNSRQLVLQRIQNGTSAPQRAEIGDALFGGVGRGLINRIHVGAADANPYTQMRSVLQKLGVTASVVDGHENHFHIYMQPPAPLAIAANNNLLAESSLIHVSDQSANSKNTASSVVVAGAPKKYKKIFSTCDLIYFDPEIGGGEVVPLGKFNFYIASLPENKNKLFTLDFSQAKVRVIQPFKHGTLSPHPTLANSFTMKRFDKEYFGPDSAAFEIEYKGQLYRMNVKALLLWDDYKPEDDGPCNGRLRVTGQAQWSQTYVQQTSPTDVPLDGWLQQDEFATLLAAASGTVLAFSDLPGMALGETVGAGSAAQISLDADAAGHG
jgi:hypothetical protein